MRCYPGAPFRPPREEHAGARLTADNAFQGDPDLQAGAMRVLDSASPK